MRGVLVAGSYAVPAAAALALTGFFILLGAWTPAALSAGAAVLFASVIVHDRRKLAALLGRPRPHGDGPADHDRPRSDHHWLARQWHKPYGAALILVMVFSVALIAYDGASDHRVVPWHVGITLALTLLLYLRQRGR